MPDEQYKFLIKQIDIARRANLSTNINCGALRRIGKTYALKQMIREYNSANPQETIAILIVNSNLIGEYSEFRNNRFIRIITLNGVHNHLLGYDAAVFADEVPNVEDLISNFNNVHFIAGFYSIPYSSSIYLNNPRLIENREELMKLLEQWSQDPQAQIIVDNHPNFEYVDKRIKITNNKMKFIQRH